MSTTYAGPSPLKLARILAGKTQRQLAAQASLSHEQLSQLERGAQPNLRTARALAGALGVELDLLFPPLNGEGPARDGSSSTTAADGPRDVPSV